MAKEILHIKKISEDQFSINVGDDVLIEELEFGIADVMYKIILKYMEADGLEDNLRNFNATATKYAKAVQVNTGAIYDQLHPDDKEDE